MGVDRGWLHDDETCTLINAADDKDMTTLLMVDTAQSQDMMGLGSGHQAERKQDGESGKERVEGGSRERERGKEGAGKEGAG